MTLVILLLSVAEARTWTVDAMGGGDVTTVDAGVALLGEGDTLEVRPGRYEVVNLNLFASDVRIVGAGPDQTIFVPPAGEPESAVVALLLLGDGAMLEGIGFEDYAAASTGVAYAVGVEGRSTSIQDCRFMGDGVGVRVGEGVLALVTVTDSLFVGNRAGVAVSDTVDELKVENSRFIDDEVAIAFTATYTAGAFNLISIVHNTVVGGGIGVEIGSATYGYAGEGATEVTIANNAFADLEYSWLVDLHDGYTPSGEIRNNVYTPGSMVILDDGSPILVSDNIESDLSFVAWSDDGDWRDDDLHLVEGSAAVDVGVAGYAVESGDADGLARPIDGDGDSEARPDAGAYEYCPSGDCPFVESSDDPGSVEPGDTGTADTGTADTGAHDTGYALAGDSAAVIEPGCASGGCSGAGPRGLTGPALGALAALALRRRALHRAAQPSGQPR